MNTMYDTFSDLREYITDIQSLSHSDKRFIIGYTDDKEEAKEAIFDFISPFVRLNYNPKSKREFIVAADAMGVNFGEFIERGVVKVKAFESAVRFHLQQDINATYAKILNRSKFHKTFGRSDEKLVECRLVEHGATYEQMCAAKEKSR